ncbi:MAG: glutaminyl-peptide cyclotransferase [Actinomycetota bacterium]|nr:glutaminyl-peptide cyclotransferase [Actinomycetota bacterium]
MFRATLLALAVGSCSGDTAQRALPSRPPDQLVVRVLRTYPHDASAFTQGLVYSSGRVYESTGIAGRSSVRRVRLEDGRVETLVALPPELFGEGLARVGGKLVQLTWQNAVALVWHLDDLRKAGAHSYQGEGWGLCYDGRRLVMSSGTDQLVFRDPETFRRTGAVTVVSGGQPVPNLNELECTKGAVYANIWQEERIARIDTDTGEVTAWIDASGLLTAEEWAAADVLNGIAYVPERDTFLLTGKFWPRLFEVKFEPRPNQ